MLAKAGKYQIDPSSKPGYLRIIEGVEGLRIIHYIKKRVDDSYYLEKTVEQDAKSSDSEDYITFKAYEGAEQWGDYESDVQYYGSEDSDSTSDDEDNGIHQIRNRHEEYRARYEAEEQAIPDFELVEDVGLVLSMFEDTNPERAYQGEDRDLHDILYPYSSSPLNPGSIFSSLYSDAY